MNAAVRELAITGAAGNLGRAVLAELLRRGERPLALTRDPGAVRVAAPAGVEVRAADFAEPGGTAAALGGVRRLLLVSTNRSPERLGLHRAAIGAAVAAGVEHLVYTSVVRAADPGNPVAEATDHGATERLLRESGLAHTVLRFNVWPEMLVLSRLAHRAVATGRLPSAAGEGRTGFVTRADTAGVAAAVLADGLPTGTAPTSAPASAPAQHVLNVTGAGLTDREVAEALASATGRPVRHVPVPDDRVAAELTALGLAAPMARGWGENDPARRAGWFDVPEDATAARLLGRPLTPLVEFFAAHRAELTT
ncbi:NAD(P)H-binding protein [Kitasatospora sp. NPDC051853]|uniref:NAD(P)H-binding protein n=1 Tax=Kitasatospora sp. NPDC051853 TaxID=3364058 RepID=UPI00379BDDD8